MEKAINQEEQFFLIYKTLLSVLEECKGSQYLTKFSIDIEKQVREFEEEYPEIVSEYYFKHK